MRQTVIVLAVGLLCGFAFSAFWGRQDAPVFGAGPDRASNVEARFAAIEMRLAASEAARAGLEREVAELRQARAASAEFDEAIAGAHAPASAADLVEDAPGFPQAPAVPRGRSRGEDRVERLVAAGFRLDQAEAVERRVEQLQLDAMQARYEAARQGGSIDSPVERFFDASAVLRSELGDADYERYRTALGLPTAVNVRNVLSSSAAERAGIEPGDQIVAYSGQRIFEVGELNQVLLQGEAGETVLVDIIRDGQPMQVAIERGPLGISSGFGGRGNRPLR